jgi:DNA-binding NtrC family response regulator
MVVGGQGARGHRGVSKMSTKRILVLAAEWQPRALLRAQLIESGFDVVATDTWPGAREQFLTDGLPHVVIMDLRGLEHPDSILDELAKLTEPAHVLVVTAEGTVPSESLARFGFEVLRRPVSIDTIVSAARKLVRPVDTQP